MLDSPGVSAATSMPPMPFMSASAGQMVDMAGLMMHAKTENNMPIGTGEHIPLGVAEHMPLFMTHDRISSADSASLVATSTLTLKPDPGNAIEITPQITAS